MVRVDPTTGAVSVASLRYDGSKELSAVFSTDQPREPSPPASAGTAEVVADGSEVGTADWAELERSCRVYTFTTREELFVHLIQLDSQATMQVREKHADEDIREY
jgi:hypothetical protein